MIGRRLCEWSIAMGIALAVGSAPAASASFFADAEAGGGYDSNLNAASSMSDAEGDGFALASLGAGVETVGKKLDAHLGLRANGLSYFEFTDLSVGRFLIEAGLRGRAGERFSWRLSPSFGTSIYGDDDRNSLDYRASGAGRVALGRPVWIEAGYAYTYRNAKVSEFERMSHRGWIAVGSDPWHRGHLRLTAGAEYGPVVRYLPQSPGGGGGAAAGRRNNTFGNNLVANREGSTTADVTLLVEQGITDRIFFAVDGSYAHIWSEPDDFDAFSSSASFGIRWP